MLNYNEIHSRYMVGYSLDTPWIQFGYGIHLRYSAGYASGYRIQFRIRSRIRGYGAGYGRIRSRIHKNSFRIF